MTTKTEAAIEDLYKVEGRAELVNGEIILTPPAGDMPGYAGDEICVSLREHSRRTERGRAVGTTTSLPRQPPAPQVMWCTGGG